MLPILGYVPYYHTCLKARCAHEPSSLVVSPPLNRTIMLMTGSCWPSRWCWRSWGSGWRTQNNHLWSGPPTSRQVWLTIKTCFFKDRVQEVRLRKDRLPWTLWDSFLAQPHHFTPHTSQLKPVFPSPLCPSCQRSPPTFNNDETRVGSRILHRIVTSRDVLKMYLKFEISNNAATVLTCCSTW